MIRMGLRVCPESLATMEPVLPYEGGSPAVRRWLLRPFPDTSLEASPQRRVLLQDEQKRLLWEERSSRFVDARVEELPCGEVQRGRSTSDDG